MLGKKLLLVAAGLMGTCISSYGSQGVRPSVPAPSSPPVKVNGQDSVLLNAQIEMLKEASKQERWSPEFGQYVKL